MRTMILPALLAGALAIGTVPAGAAPTSVAAPLPPAAAQPGLTLVSGGCGPFRHRGFNGFCYPGGGIYRRPFYRGYYRPFGYYRPYRPFY